MCVCVYAWVYLHFARAGTNTLHKRASDSLEPELQAVLEPPEVSTG